MGYKLKVIIAGCRNVFDYSLLLDAISYSEYKITEVVGGGAKGADELGMIWATQNDIKFTLFPEDWNMYGKAAGPIRNRQMAEYADALIALWDGESKGTRNMIDEARKQKLKIHISLTKEGFERLREHEQKLNALEKFYEDKK